MSAINPALNVAKFFMHMTFILIAKHQGGTIAGPVSQVPSFRSTF